MELYLPPVTSTNRAGGYRWFYEDGNEWMKFIIKDSKYLTI